MEAIQCEVVEDASIKKTRSIVGNEELGTPSLKLAIVEFGLVYIVSPLNMWGMLSAGRDR